MIRAGLIITGIGLVLTALAFVDNYAYTRGYNTKAAEIADVERKAVEELKRRMNDAAKADDVARRCSADPACRLQSDEYERR